jgi:hypothetical protein
MKNRFKPGTRTDAGLGTGWAYFVDNDEYKTFLLNYVSEKDVRYLISLFAYAELTVWFNRSQHAAVSLHWT